MEIQFVRHATIILNYNGKKLLIDPLFSAKGALPAIEGVPNTNANPLVDLPMPVSALVDCDAVIVTHTHRDHFDPEAIKLLPKDMAIFCQPEDEEKIRSFGFCNVTAVGDETEYQGIEISRTQGRHGHGDIAKQMAPVSGFVFRAKDEATVYLPGDTVWCSPVKAAIKKYRPDIIICNCGGARFSKGKPITMNEKDILSVAKALPDSKIVAVHMETWNHCRVTRQMLRDFVIENDIDERVMIPLDGHLIEL